MGHVKWTLGLWPGRINIMTPTEDPSFLFANKNIKMGAFTENKNKEENSVQGLLHSQKVTGKDGQNPVCLSNISLCEQQALTWLWVQTPWKSCTALVWFIWFLTHQTSWDNTRLATFDQFAPQGFESPWSSAEWATVSKYVLNPRKPSWWKLVHGLAKCLGSQKNVWMEPGWFNYWPWTTS